MRKAGVWVSVAMLAASGAVSAGINGAVDDQVVAVQGHPVVIDVYANDVGVGGLRGLKIRSRPAHGSASVVGGRIRYAPLPGFTGRDRFSYIVVGAGGTGTATVSVDVGEGLVLRGGVPEGVLAGAAVTATVGATEFTTHTDADGRYTLRIASPENGMVKLDVRGGAEQSHVRLVSVVGDIDRLTLEAGSDATLAREENNQVQVSSLSTAQARLLQASNGGLAIGSSTQLVAAREGMDYPQLLRQAAAVRLAISGMYPLPSGTQDTLAMISDPAVLTRFIASVDSIDPAALPNTIGEIVADTDVIVPASPDELIGSHALMFNMGPPGALNMQYLQGLRLTLAGGGGGSYVTATPNSDASVTWTFASGVADIVPNQPISRQLFRFMPDFRQVRAIVTPVGYQVSKLFDGDGHDTWSMTTTQLYTHPDNPEYPPETVTSSGATLAINDGVGVLPISASEIIGTRTLWIPESHTSSPPVTSGGSEVFGFFPNGTGQRSYGTPVTFTWSIDAQGRLVINVNGDTARFHRVKGDGRKADGLLGEWITGSARSARFSVSALVDGFTFDAANAERAWRSGFITGTSSAEPNGDTVFVLDPNRIAWQRTVPSTGQAFSSPLSWRLLNGVVEILTYRNGNNQQVHECQPGVNGCRITMVRRWRPASRDGDRIYVIEEFMQDLDGNGTLEMSQQRTNYYDEIPRPQLSAGSLDALRFAAKQAPQVVAPMRSAPATLPARGAAPARD